jgi:hypothetical protein
VPELLIAQPLLFQARADPGPEEDGVEGFGQIVLGALLDATGHAVDLVDGRDHDHRDVT